MKFSREEMRSIVERSSTLQERLSGAFEPRNIAGHSSEIRKRWKAWRTIMSGGQGDHLIAKRLEWGKINPRTARAVLGDVRLAEGHPLPEWTAALNEVLAVAVKGPRDVYSSLKSEPSLPFEHILVPFVNVASERLVFQAGPAMSLVSAEAYNSLKRSLLSRLAQVCFSALSLEYSIRYLPGDRHREGVLADMTVRENFSLRSQWADSSFGVIRTSVEQKRTVDAIERFGLRTPSMETPVQSLSGGNQQKLLLASVLASNPEVILIDEPTQGVDVGARAEIYRMLRETAARGRAIIVLSSEAQEVAGLSDRVLVFSRGRIVETLVGPQVTEGNITSAMLKSTNVREPTNRLVRPFWRWAAGDLAPLVMVATAILLMGTVATVANPFYFTPRSIGGMLILIATLALVAYGQQIVMLIGGIDLSVGPLMGLVQVVASFFVVAGAPPEHQLLGFAIIVMVSISIGLVNWALVDPLGLHPMVATLATFMALQAVSLLLRPMPGGMFDRDILNLMGIKVGIVPLTMIVAIATALLFEFILYRSRFGVSLRGFGSRAEAARVVGVKPRLMCLSAYVGCSLMAGMAGITLMQQIGLGDPRAGLGYTLTSIAAVAIGGASLFGARGSFLGALLGAAFITQVNSVTSFLGLDQAWQSYLLGAMIIAAVALYSRSRHMVVAA